MSWPAWPHQHDFENMKMESLYCFDCSSVDTAPKKRGANGIIPAVLWMLTTTALLNYWIGLIFLIAALAYPAITKQKGGDACGQCGSENLSPLGENSHVASRHLVLTELMAGKNQAGNQPPQAMGRAHVTYECKETEQDHAA